MNENENNPHATLRAHVDLRALVAALHANARRSRELKSLLRRPWPEGETAQMAAHQRALVRLRRETTELCVLRAWLRGRFHLRKPLREGAWPGMVWNQARYHADVAERVARRFPNPQPVSA